MAVRNGRTDGPTRTDAYEQTRTDGRTDADGRTDGQLDEGTEGRTDGWMVNIRLFRP